MVPGEERELVVLADAPITVAILCFLTTPPPPGFKPCQECGTFPLTIGQPFIVRAPRDLFHQVGGELRVTVREETGDERSFTIAVAPIPAPVAPATDGDAFAAAQKQFEQEYGDAVRTATTIAWEAMGRRVIAYGFKLVAALGGLAVTTGVDAQAAQVIGATIAVALVLDTTFSNFERLLLSVEARNAYRRLLRLVRHQHQTQLIPMLELKKSDESAAKKMGTKMYMALLTELHSKREEIQHGVEVADLRFLRSIAPTEA
jgi:hypothetical protein